MRRVELWPESKRIGLRLPQRLLDEVRVAAEAGNIPYQRFVRMAIVRAFGAQIAALPERNRACACCIAAISS